MNNKVLVDREWLAGVLEDYESMTGHDELLCGDRDYCPKDVNGNTMFCFDCRMQDGLIEEVEAASSHISKKKLSVDAIALRDAQQMASNPLTQGGCRTVNDFVEYLQKLSRLLSYKSLQISEPESLDHPLWRGSIPEVKTVLEKLEDMFRHGKMNAAEWQQLHLLAQSKDSNEFQEVENWIKKHDTP